MWVDGGFFMVDVSAGRSGIGGMLLEFIGIERLGGVFWW